MGCAHGDNEQIAEQEADFTEVGKVGLWLLVWK